MDIERIVEKQMFENTVPSHPADYKLEDFSIPTSVVGKLVSKEEWAKTFFRRKLTQGEANEIWKGYVSQIIDIYRNAPDEPQEEPLRRSEQSYALSPEEAQALMDKTRADKNSDYYSDDIRIREPAMNRMERLQKIVNGEETTLEGFNDEFIRKQREINARNSDNKHSAFDGPSRGDVSTPGIDKRDEERSGGYRDRLASGGSGWKSSLRGVEVAPAAEVEE